MQKRKSGNYLACFIIFFVGFVFFLTSQMIYKKSDASKDLSNFETVTGVMFYSTHEGSGDNTMYSASVTYIVDNEYYEWEMGGSVSPKPADWENGRTVTVYYNPLNPADSAVPELSSAAMVFVLVFKYFGIVLMFVGGFFVILAVIKLGLLAGILGVSSLANKKKNQQYMNNQNNFGGFNGQGFQNQGFNGQAFPNQGQGLGGLGNVSVNDFNNQNMQNNQQNLQNDYWANQNNQNNQNGNYWDNQQ